jgi:hypothetical protein
VPDIEKFRKPQPCQREDKYLWEAVGRGRILTALSSLLSATTIHFPEHTTNPPAMPKERSINPAQAQRKAEKAKAVKKGSITLPRVLESALPLALLT